MFSLLTYSFLSISYDSTCRWPAEHLCTSGEPVKSCQCYTSGTERYDSLHTEGTYRIIILSLHFNGHFSRCTWVSLYQNFSVLDFIGTKDDGGGGDYGSYKMCKAAVKLSPATNQHPVLLQAGCLSCHSTNSVRALMERWKDISYDRSLQLKIFICEYM